MTKKRHNRLTSQDLISIQQNVGGSKVNTLFQPPLPTHRGERPEDAYEEKPNIEALEDLQKLGEESCCKCVIL